MHEKRAMKYTEDISQRIQINGVNIERLLHVKFKDAFSEEDRRQEIFTKFFKQYYFSNDECAKFGVQHVG